MGKIGESYAVHACVIHITLLTVYFPDLRLRYGAGEIPQRLRALIALADDPDSGPNSQTVAHLHVCSSHLQVIQSPLLTSVGTTYMWCTCIHIGKRSLQ